MEAMPRASAILTSAYPPSTVTSDTASGASQSSQLAIEKGVCPLVGECCGLSVVMCPTMPREGMILTRIAVDCRGWFLSKCCFNLSLRSLGNELILLGQMH